ncbi:MAG: broad specificity phosphatase PhoE [Glaciecola sp.]|jgi:broad specificity phosphatase PhoE
MILVIRHAVAGERAQWRGTPDARRPLSGRGRKQANALVKQHKNRPLERLLSSPYDRCIQTLEPLAVERGLQIEVHPALEEGASWKAIRSLLEEVTNQDVALCSHGDVIGTLITHLEKLGAKKPKREQWSKASTWVLEVQGGAIRRARYKEPPR